MKWEVAFGDRIDMLKKIQAREGKTPPALASQPEVLPHAVPYFTAFKRLHSSRMIAPDGSPGGIPLSEISAYAEMFAYNSLVDRFDLMRYVQACDSAYLEECKRRRPSTKNGRTGKHTTRRR